MNNETKKCPFCGEEININAIKCKHCGEWLAKIEEKEPANVQSTKCCQFCGKIIPKTAEKCPFCREWLVRKEDARHENGNGWIVSALIWAPTIFIILPLTIALQEEKGAAVVLLIFVLTGIFLEIYFLPTRIAMDRRHTYAIIVFLINLFFGATILGWIIALVVALSQRRGRNSLL